MSDAFLRVREYMATPASARSAETLTGFLAQFQAEELADIDEKAQDVAWAIRQPDSGIDDPEVQAAVWDGVATVAFCVLAVKLAKSGDVAAMKAAATR
jgi:hypothetical protein